MCRCKYLKKSVGFCSSRKICFFKKWKSFFGVYLKFAWLKTSKNSISRIFYAKTWPRGVIFALFGCFDVIPGDLQGHFEPKVNQKWLFLRISTRQIPFMTCDTPKKLFQILEVLCITEEDFHMCIFGKIIPKNLLFCTRGVSLSWVFCVFLRPCAVQVCFVDQDSILFLRKVRFSHVMGNEKVRKNIGFFHETKKYLISKVCAKVTQVWKIGNCPKKRKIERSKGNVLGELYRPVSRPAWSRDQEFGLKMCEFLSGG